MPNRYFRPALFISAVVAGMFTVIGGCTEDENPNPGSSSLLDSGTGVDGTSNRDVITSQFDSTVNPSDTSTNTDTGSNTDTGAPDAGDAGDAGSDADATADTGVDAGPPLCTTYPNSLITGDAQVPEGDLPRYQMIALRAIFTRMGGAAFDSCQIGQHFQNAIDPAQADCLGEQLAFVAQCAAPVNYEANAQDQNGFRCVPDAGNVVQLGFRDPQDGGYHVADLDYLFDLVRDSALTVGMSPADADRLRALLVANRGKALTKDAGADAGDAGYTNSTCP